MKVQRLIEKYKKLEGVWDAPGAETARQIFLQDLEQLDEPQKVKIPQVIAEYIKQKKDDDYHLLGAMIEIRSHKNKEIDEWFEEDDNMELFARAWLDGYKPEEEKRHLVKVKGVNEYGCYLNKGLLSKEYFLESKAEIGGCRTKHTRKQLEDDDFGWVFDCEGIEIEEVE